MAQNSVIFFTLFPLGAAAVEEEDVVEGLEEVELSVEVGLVVALDCEVTEEDVEEAVGVALEGSGEGVTLRWKAERLSEEVLAGSLSTSVDGLLLFVLVVVEGTAPELGEEAVRLPVEVSVLLVRCAGLGAMTGGLDDVAVKVPPSALPTFLVVEIEAELVA